MKNKRWKRTAKRVQGICMREHSYYCNECRAFFDCINKMGWGGCYIGIREAEKRIRQRNIERAHPIKIAK